MLERAQCRIRLTNCCGASDKRRKISSLASSSFHVDVMMMPHAGASSPFRCFGGYESRCCNLRGPLLRNHWAPDETKHLFKDLTWDIFLHVDSQKPSSTEIPCFYLEFLCSATIPADRADPMRRVSTMSHFALLYTLLGCIEVVFVLLAVWATLSRATV